MDGNRKVAAICFSVAVGMLAMAYASVPLYRLFCQATGFGGTTQRAAKPSPAVIDRVVTVRFDANVSPGLNWDFGPVEQTMTLKLGETGHAVYNATNHSDQAVVGTSSFNVTPDQAGAFFNKIECFCFTEQRLEPGQTVEMPVTFFVDPAMASDTDGAQIRNITLSYTFYRIDEPKKVGTAPAAATPPQVGGKGS